MNNRRIAERLGNAIQSNDMAAFAEIHAPDVIVVYPQSGEVFNGIDNFLAMLSNYPGGLASARVDQVRGQEASVHVTAPLPFGMPLVTITGAGDSFILEGVADYGDDGVYNIAIIADVRNGRISKSSWYFAERFEAPDWRKPYTG